MSDEHAKDTERAAATTSNRRGEALRALGQLLVSGVFGALVIVLLDVAAEDTRAFLEYRLHGWTIDWGQTWRYATLFWFIAYLSASYLGGEFACGGNVRDFTLDVLHSLLSFVAAAALGFIRYERGATEMSSERIGWTFGCMLIIALTSLLPRSPGRKDPTAPTAAGTLEGLLWPRRGLRNVLRLVAAITSLAGLPLTWVADGLSGPVAVATAVAWSALIGYGWSVWLGATRGQVEPSLDQVSEKLNALEKKADEGKASATTQVDEVTKLQQRLESTAKRVEQLAEEVAKARAASGTGPATNGGEGA